MTPAPEAGFCPSSGSEDAGGAAITGRLAEGQNYKQGTVPRSYLRELFILGVPEEEVQEALRQNHRGTEGLWGGDFGGRRAGRVGGVQGVRAARGRAGELGGCLAEPLGGVIQEGCSGRSVSSLLLALLLVSMVERRLEHCCEFGASLNYTVSFRIAKAKE